MPCRCFYTGCGQKIHQLSVYVYIVENNGLGISNFKHADIGHVGFFSGWIKIGAVSPLVATDMGSCGATMHVLCQCPVDEVRKIIGYKKAANRMLLGLSDHDRAFQSELTVWKLEGELSTLIYSGNSLHLIYFSILKNVLSR